MSRSQSAQLLRLSALLGEDAPLEQNINTSRISSINNVNNKSGFLTNLFIKAGITPPSLSRLIFSTTIVCLFTFVLYTLIGILSLALPLAIGLVFYLRIKLAISRRAEAFERDYPAFLLSLSSSIRTGIDPLMAFSQCGELFPQDSVLRSEVQKTSLLIERGAQENAAIGNFARTIDHPDIGLFRAAMILSRQQGSSLGACLHRLTRVTRQRQSFRRKTSAAVAMQRLSAFGIAGCTIIVGMIQGTSNPQAIKDAFNHPAGRIGLMLGLGLVVVGLLWMLRMSRRRI
jgi:tight adherence protein B